jgi:hypothetical protein
MRSQAKRNYDKKWYRKNRKLKVAYLKKYRLTLKGRYFGAKKSARERNLDFSLGFDTFKRIISRPLLRR